jgi:tetratricopeptide (TPR) repeat protein
MAKIRTRKGSTAGSNIAPTTAEPGNLETQKIFDAAIFVGLFLVILVVPFLYSRMTTENFLTPKEFVSKIAMGLILAAFCAYFPLSGKVNLRSTRIDMPLTLFILWWVLSLIWNYNVSSAVRDLRGCFLLLMLFPIIVNTVRTRWQFDGLIWAMVLAGVATSLLGIMEAYNIYFRWDPKIGWFVFARDEIFNGIIDYRAYYLPLFPQLASKTYDMSSIVSTFGNRNYLGTFSMFTAFLPIAFCFYYRNYAVKALSFGLFIIMAVGLMITRCRAAAIGIFAGLMFMFGLFVLLNRDWKSLRRNIIFFPIVGIALLAILLAAAQTSSFSMLDKMRSTLTLNRSTSNTYERLWVWYATYQSFAKNPVKWVIGSGFGSYKHFFPLQEADTFTDDNKETFTSVTFRQAHNDWLQLVSELGLIGLALFLWLLWRFYQSIFLAIKEDMQSDQTRDLYFGSHLLLIGLGAGMVAQLTAAIPDFPFHRIETALYAVLVLALVPVFAETRFFRKPLPVRFSAGEEHALPLGVLGIMAGLMAGHFEVVCWNADRLVREADMAISSRNPEAISGAKGLLQKAIAADPLPGDPYLKLSSILEMEGRGEEALQTAEQSYKNINFNARSTYHSTVFRIMHTHYHILHNLDAAMNEAKRGLYLTCGDARSIYYYYLGRIALDKGDIPTAEFAFRRCLNYPSFAAQGGANLAVILATQQKWQEALEVAASISRLVGDTDATLHDIVGISASNLGQHATAEASLRKAVSLNDAQPIFKRDLGITLMRQNKADEARQYLEQAHAATSLPANIKPEVEGLLASISVYFFDLGKRELAAGNVAAAQESMAKVVQARVVPEPVKKEAQAIIEHIGRLPAERGPLPAEAVPQLYSPTPPASAPQGSQ